MCPEAGQIALQVHGFITCDAGQRATMFNSDISIKILFSKVDSPETHATFGVFCFCCTSKFASFQENQL